MIIRLKPPLYSLDASVLKIYIEFWSSTFTASTLRDNFLCKNRITLFGELSSIRPVFLPGPASYKITLLRDYIGLLVVFCQLLGASDLLSDFSRENWPFSPLISS